MVKNWYNKKRNNAKKIRKRRFSNFFWDNNSPGTKHGIEYCKRNKIPYIVFNYTSKTIF